MDPSIITCNIITSCAEAIGYYSLGAKELDKDGDGIPCDNLCIK